MLLATGELDGVYQLGLGDAGEADVLFVPQQVDSAILAEPALPGLIAIPIVSTGPVPQSPKGESGSGSALSSETSQ